MGGRRSLLPGRCVVGVLGLVAAGCSDLPEEAVGTSSTSSSGTSSDGSTGPAPTSSSGPELDSSGTTSPAGTGSTSSPESTTTDGGGSSSSEDTGEPLPLCGDGLVAMGELCHELGPPIMLGAAAWRIATGDLDQDGATDLIVANPSLFDVQVLYGVGNGDFVAPQVLLTADAAVDDLVLDDLTGDGWPDLVLTDDTNLRVVSYANDGAGGLFFAGLYPATVAPLRLTTGDVDGDGTPDLVAAGNGTAALMLGNGLAGFLPFQDLTMPAGPHRLGLFDLDGDGRLDLLVVNQNGGNVTGFLGDGMGFGDGTNHDTANAPVGLAVGDVDGNGPVDLLVAHPGGDTLGVLLGDGAGAFGSEDLLPVGDDPRSVVLADLDDDGHLDVALAHTTPGEVSLHLGVGDGSFVPGPVFDVGGANELAVAELNGDGVPDVVVLRPGEAALQVLRSAP